MQRIIDFISQNQRSDLDSPKLPPVHLWNPQKVIDNDMLIDSQGRWFHEGGEIERLPLCQLFASILRKENDDYFLITPGEKFPIVVEDVPFLLSSVYQNQDGLIFVSSLNEKFKLEEQRIFELRDYKGVMLPYLQIRDELFARVSRNCFYDLIEMSESVLIDDLETYRIKSAGQFYIIGSM